MKKHKPNCLIFICTCGESVEEEKYMKKLGVLLLLGLSSCNFNLKDEVKDPCNLWSKEADIYVCDIGTHIIFSKKGEQLMFMQKTEAPKK